MTFAQKVLLFSMRRYLIPIPETIPEWTIREWIDYVDNHGKWLPVVLPERNKEND